MSSLSTLPKGDSAWLLRKSIQRIMQQVSVLETNIGSSTTGNSANTQVIFNDNGTLRGDTGLTFNKTTDTLGTGRLTTSGDAIVCSSTGDFYVGTTLSPQFKVERATGSATITGDLTVDTNVLKVNTTTNRVGINTTTPSQNLEITGSGNPLVADGCSAVRLNNTVSGRPAVVGVDDSQNFVIWNVGTEASETIKFLTGGGNGKEQYRITHGGVFNWYDGAGGTRMTLNATGLGVGTSNFAYKLNAAGFIAAVDPSFTGTGGSLIGAMLNNDNTAPGLDLRRWTGTAGTHGTTYIATDATGATFFYNGQQASNTKATALRLTLGTGGLLALNGGNAAANGVGINFPATQVASSDANTLDDYFETTFSPTIVGSTDAGIATYTTQIGRATKIGRLVTFSIRVAYSAGTGTGNLRVGNLPFAAGAGSIFAVYAENIALTAGNYPVCGISSGNTFISIDQLPTGGGAAAAVPYDAAGDIQISGSYIV